MSSPHRAPPASYRFDNVQLFPDERRLQIDGQPVALGARAFDVLLALIERRGRLVKRDELLDLVWPDLAVEPNNLAVQVGALRKVLGPHVIATIPGRGYRFSATVDEPMPVAAPVDRAVRRRTNLPGDPAPLIGRDNDLRCVGELLGAHRLVTLVGAGGIGKTRLAQWLLHHGRDTYRHGVCWIELAAITDAASLPGAIAAALGITLAGGASGTALAAVLAPLEILIALDNAEHLLAEVGRLVVALLAAAPRLRLIVTSQAPLRLPEEQVYRLGALAVPSLRATTAQALGYGAIQLFVQRAQSVDARFALTDGNTASAIRVCARLDGLPLAIEFAAARAPLLGMERLVASLDERLRFLKSGYRSAPARQQTMRATLEWSHQLLGDDERIVFRRLAVVAGSASLRLVEAIVADDEHVAADASHPLDRWAVIDALGALVDRSLVTLVPDDHDPDGPRYLLLETPRAYAAERLAEAGEVALLEGRHAHAMATLLDDAWTERWSGRVGFRAWVERVEADRDNARVAFAWALRHDAFPLMLAMAPVLLARAPGGSSYEERAVVAEAIDRWLTTQPIEASQLTARVQLMRFWTERELPRGLQEAERALPLAAACGDRLAAYILNAWLVRAYAQARNLDAAAAALARVEALEDPAWPAIRLWVGADARSIYRLTKGPPEAALALLREELRIVHLAGESGFVSAATLIDAELLAGNAAAAAEQGWKLVDELRDSRDAFSLLVVRINLTAALLAMDDVARAKSVAMETWRIAGHFALQGDCAAYLGLICALEGRWAAAAALVGYADRVYAQRGAQPWMSELKAHDRTVELTRAALGESAFERLARDGGRLSDEEVAVVAFGEAWPG
jgi:predicted ATPase/DNA-binding winged helix-turn-helix (wHTH) protein